MGLDLVLVYYLGEPGAYIYENGPSVRMRVNVWNTCLRSVGGGLLGVGLGTSFVSMHGSKLGLSKGVVDRNMVVLRGGKKDLEFLDQ